MRQLYHAAFSEAKGVLHIIVPGNIIEHQHTMTLNSYAKVLKKTFEKPHEEAKHSSSTINPLVSEMASWYERFRNSIEYREEEMILRASIERILKRKLALNPDKNKVGEELVRELAWSKHIPEESITPEITKSVSESISLHLLLKESVSKRKDVGDGPLNSFIYNILSSDIENILSPSKERETVENYIFHILSKNMKIEKGESEDENVQLYIAIKKTYSKNDQALLEYNLFKQYFGDLSGENFEKTSKHFLSGYKTIKSQLNHPLRYKILNYVKRQIPPFLILEDILRQDPTYLNLIESEEERFNSLVKETCNKRYETISGKVRRAIIRSIIFIALSKVFFAFTIEATYDNIVHQEIFWGPLIVNIIGPIFIMIIVSLLIKVPGEKNTLEILRRIKILITDADPMIGKPLVIKGDDERNKSALYTFFTLLSLTGFMAIIGLIVMLLMRFHFTIASQGIFLFFLSVVSFLAYRINQTAQIYTAVERQNFLTPIIDLFFMPIARMGRHLTEGISQINIFLFILDFLIETPYKGLLSFFEQWFFFLHSKRDEMS